MLNITDAYCLSSLLSDINGMIGNERKKMMEKKIDELREYILCNRGNFELLSAKWGLEKRKIPFELKTTSIGKKHFDGKQPFLLELRDKKDRNRVYVSGSSNAFRIVEDKE